MPPSKTTLDHIHTCMSEPHFRADNDGYALPVDIAKACRRNPGVVLALLHWGEATGHFESRPHPTARRRGSDQRLREYRALVAGPGLSYGGREPMDSSQG